MATTALPVSVIGAQIGVETTEQTPVPANKRLLSLGFSRIEEDPIGGETFKGQGHQLPTAGTPPKKRTSKFTFDGKMTYNADPYIFSSGIKKVTPVADGTNGFRWSWAHSLTAIDARQTYTYHSGNPTRAQSCAGAHVDAIKLEMSDTLSKISGNFFGLKMSDDITITPNPTVISPLLVYAHLFDVRIADTHAGLAGASVFPLPLMVTLDVPDLNDRLSRMNSSDTSFHARVPKALEGITLQFKVGSNDTDFAQFLTKLDTGDSQWIRVQALGDVIAPDSQYEFTLDFNGFLAKPPTPDETNSAATYTFTFQALYDATAGFAYRIEYVNELASLS